MAISQGLSVPMARPWHIVGRIAALCGLLPRHLFLQVLVMESVADELVTKVKAGVDKLSVGRPEVPP